MSHINPLIDEINSATKEYKDKTKTAKTKLKTSLGRNTFSVTLQKELKKFVVTDLPRLYPLAANRKQRPCSKEKVFPAPTDPGTCFSASGISSQKSSFPSAADVVEILNLSLVRESKGSAPVHPPSMDIPIYDLSSLSGSELEQILQYFGRPSVKPFSRDSVIKELSLFIPKCTVLPRQSGGDQESLSATKRLVCQQCGRTGFFLFSFLRSFATCFACKNVFCRECLSSPRRKIPTSGSYDLRSLCKTCLTTFNSREAATWLTHGQTLLATDKKHLEAVLAMCNLSNELHPSEIAIIKQAQALFYCKKHERLVCYGKDVLRNSTFERENTLELQKLVAESLLKLARDADDSDLLRKADKYEEAIQWTAQFTEESEASIRDLKVEAMRRRLHCVEVHERITKQRIKKLFSHLIAAIREGSLLKVFTILQHMDEEAKDACLKQLSTEPPETYSPYGILLLRLAQTTLTFKQDPTGAVRQIADIFWTNYSLFMENGSREHIFEFVSHFTCQLLKGGHKLLLETLREITPTNFMQCLHLSEDDIFSPPDIENRRWENVVVEGCDMKMFLKYELAVKKLSKSKSWSPVKVALCYYDLIPACNHPSQLLVTLITSAQWFARQISLPNSNNALQYSCKKMILKLTNLAAALSFEFGVHPYLQYYVARLVLGLQFYAFSKTPCGSQDDAETIGKHLKWLVAAGRLCPLHNMPIVSPAESVILHIISRDLYSDYLLKLQDEPPTQMRPVSEAILRYHIYENHWRKRCQLQDPTGDGLRLTAMTELLHAEDWSWDGVQQLLQWNMVPLDSEGWRVSSHRLLEPVASSGIHQLVGLEVNKNDFSIQLLIRKQTRQSPSLLCWEDVAVGLTRDQPGCFFSLEAVTPQETLYHPFNEQIFEPKELQASRFLSTLFHTDYLLKQLSTGVEISSYPPFHKRPVHEGLLKCLPSELQKALLSIPSRGPSLSRVHRFWIQADAMEYDVQENDNSVRWLFGDVNMRVRCKPMFHTQDGGLQDQDVLGPDPDSPEGSFIADFTKHYDQIGKYFPEFLRLKELCKVQWLGAFTASFEESLEEQSRRLDSEEMDAKYSEIYASAVREAQKDSREKLDHLLLEIRRQTSFISNEVVQQIYQKAGLPASYHEIYNWLRFGDSSVIAQQMARNHVPSVSQIKRQVINEHATKLKQYRRSLSTLKKSCKKCLPATELANGCCWVPAVCHCEDGKCIYGGVLLTPKPCKVTLRVGRDFSRVPLTPDSLRFHEPFKQPPVKPFNPPRTYGRKVLLTNGVGSTTGPPGGDSGGSSSPSDSEGCGSRGNLSGKGGTSFEKHNNSLRKLCPR